jgi:hypothetical protein
MFQIIIYWTLNSTVCTDILKYKYSQICALVSNYNLFDFKFDGLSY